MLGTASESEHSKAPAQIVRQLKDDRLCVERGP